MAGHNKWSSIKHKKARADAARGKVFTKIIREITVAAREGGGDLEGNPRLRLAVQNAKGANMPNDNIERAIKKGTGDLEGARYEEFTYEGYGPAGVALLIDTLSDNKNRTTAEVRHALSKHGGNLGETGCVSWNFATKGIIRLALDQGDEDSVMEAAIEAGAEDVRSDEHGHEVVTEATDLAAVSDALKAAGLEVQEAKLEKIPNTTVKLELDDAKKTLKLMDMIEDLDDVQGVSANFDIADEVLEQLQ